MGVPRAVQLDAVWGYGDGTSSTPWDIVAGETVTVADATTTTLTVVDSALYEVGATYRVEGIDPNRDEYFFVEAKPVLTTTLTVQRAVNGSTGAAHAGVAVYRIKVQPTVKNTVIKAAIRRVENEGSSNRESEKIGNYSYASQTTDSGSDFTESFTNEEAARMQRLKRYRGPGI